jgi:anaerobic magnesium-protoporphyrin IX monomethyl ester cyclase
MKVVLATAPDEDSPWNQGSFPPLGLLYLAASVRNLPDVSVELLDTYSEGLTHDQAVTRILESSPDILGVTVTSGNVMEACNLLRAVKEARPDLVTVTGGVHPTVFDALMLRELPQLDFVIRGEGDNSFPELCRRISTGEQVAGLPGLSYRSGGDIVRGEPQLVEDLDGIPTPDRTLVSPKLYGGQWYGYKLPDLAGKVTTASSSRGCPFSCTFCSMVKMCGGRFRARTTANVFDELRRISEEGFKLVIFWDDNFTADRGRVKSLCEMIIQSRLDLRFGFAGTLHQLPQSLLDLMHRAGFDLVFVGVESGSDNILEAYKKPARRKAIASGIQRAKNAHMLTVASFIAGSPKESRDDFEQTLDFVREVRPHFCDVNPLMVHPGSALWDELKGDSPATLEASHNRTIWRLTDQVEKELVEGRMIEFKKAFLRTYWYSVGAVIKRIPEIASLILHNKTVRGAVGALARNRDLVLRMAHIRLR